MAKEYISITTQNDVLSIQYKAENENAGTHFTRREYRPGEIQRVFELRGKVDTDKIKATYAEGILTIDLPKTEAAKKPFHEVPLG
jgi:HSP20 family protein